MNEMSSPDTDDELGRGHAARITIVFVLCGATLLYFADDLLITVESRLAGVEGKRFEQADLVRIAVDVYIAPLALGGSYWLALRILAYMSRRRLWTLLLTWNVLFFAAGLVLLDGADVALNHLAPGQYLASLEGIGPVSVTQGLLLELPSTAVYVVLLCVLLSTLSLVFASRFAPRRLLYAVSARQHVARELVYCFVVAEALMIASYIAVPIAAGHLVFSSPLRSAFAGNFAAREVVDAVSAFVLPPALLAGFASITTWRRLPPEYRARQDIAALGDDAVSFTATSLLEADEA
jgi:hypothetical protein